MGQKILGVNFNIASCGDSRPLQILKIVRKNLLPFSRYEFSKFGENAFFELGEFCSRENLRFDATPS